MARRTKKIEGTQESALEALRRISKQEPTVIPEWSLDPQYRDRLRMMVRAVMDFQKVRIACNNREDSPTPTNEAQLLSGDMSILLFVSQGVGDLEEAVKKSLHYSLMQSGIGRWLLEQRGLGSGWLAGYVLSEFPDIYDAAICDTCGTYCKRQVDMTYLHPAPPQHKDADLDEEPRKKLCPHEGLIMEPGTYHMHEKKPSSFVKFAGLATEPGWACPECNYLLRWNPAAKGWTHPKYKNLPGEAKPCRLCGASFKESPGDTVPSVDMPDKRIWATSIRCSPRRHEGKKLGYQSALRAKLLGKNGVADAFIMHKHPRYYEIYAGYKNRIAQRDPWRSPKWREMMARRAMVSRFIIDFFTNWRGDAGLPCRPPYEEQYLGITHHD